MGKVTSFNLVGIECWFYSNEHKPPHFHAKRAGQWHVTVSFLESRVTMIKRAKGPSGRIKKADRVALLDMAQLYREELLKEWEEKAQCNDC